MAFMLILKFRDVPFRFGGQHEDNMRTFGDGGEKRFIILFIYLSSNKGMAIRHCGMIGMSNNVKDMPRDIG